MKLHENVELFCVDGIDMIGNYDNGSIIGLDSLGLKYIKKHYPLIPKPKNKSEEEIFLSLKNLGYFNKNTKRGIEAAYLHVTNRCNLHCVGCYSFIDKRNETEDLSLKEIINILDKLRDAGVERLVFSGGEPLVRKDIDKIAKYAKEDCRIPYITLISNGTMAIEHYRNVMPFLDELSISVDGYDEGTTFIRDEGIMPMVLSNVKALSLECKIHLIFTLHKKNMMYMERYHDLANRLGVTYNFSIFTVERGNESFYPYMFDDSDLLQIAETLKNMEYKAAVQDTPLAGEGLVCRRKCEAGSKIVSVAANGDVFPCHMLMDNEFKIGNIVADKDRKLVDMVFNDNNPFFTLNCKKMSGCSKCLYQKLCGGGCRGRSFLYSGDLYDKDSYCKFISAYYRDTFESIKGRLSLNNMESQDDV